MTYQNHIYSELSKTALLRLPQVLDLIPVGKSTWWSWVAKGKAPTGIKLGPRTTVWKASDIYKLLQKLSTHDEKTRKVS